MYDILSTQSLICRVTSTLPSKVSRYMSKYNVKYVEGAEKRRRYGLRDVRKVTKELFADKYTISDSIQTFFNFKGGTGKTTLCYQISNFLAFLGFNVLMVDCDPQAHLSFSTRLEEDMYGITMYDVIVNNVPITEAIQNVCDGLDIIPSNISLTRLEKYLNQEEVNEFMLRDILYAISNRYHFIMIDTNPTISVLNKLITLASNKLNIVCETQPYSMNGLEILMQEIKEVSELMNHEIKYTIIPNKYESKTATSQEVLGMLRANYGNHVMEAIVRKCEDMNISARDRLPVIAFCNNQSTALEDIMDLTNEIIKCS